ncbi:MAG: hypothetical protein ACRDJH_13685 [Thermomicrobiales bacterium]
MAAHPVQREQNGDGDYLPAMMRIDAAFQFDLRREGGIKVAHNLERIADLIGRMEDVAFSTY